MEQKKLDFERPLLSARRYTSGAAPENGSKWKVEDSVRSVRHRPPIYKSELKSGPVSTPGTVPFDWEQIPGRPKDDESRLELCAVERSKVPKLPPGRTLRVAQKDFGKASVNPVVHKDEKISVYHDLCNVQSSDENVERSGSSSGGKESTANEDEEFVDALETLSRAESLLINCSLSDLVGLEDQGGKVSGNSPIDSQTRDLMMGRFLPAAKAMAAETPQNAKRKPPVAHHQQFRQQRVMVNEDTHPQLRYGPDFAVECLQHNEDGDEESDADYDEDGNFHGKVCGLLPGVGFRSSFCFLNPLPGMNMCSRAPTPPRRKSQTTASWSCSEADRKVSSVGLEPSKHQANRKTLENNHTPIHHSSLNKVDLPTFRELMAEENQSKDLGSGSPVAEKTLYVDTEDSVRSQHVKSCASDANGQTEFQVKKHEIGFEKRNQTHVLDSSIVDTEKSKLMENGAKSEPKFQIPDFGETNQKTRIAMQEPFGREQDIFKGSRMPEEELTKMLMRPKGPQKSRDSKIYSEISAPPALPKSPSDSWLGRTLPSISTKNTSVHYRGTWITPNEASKPKSSDPKWETMVRMTKMQDKHLPFNEDRLTTIPEV